MALAEEELDPLYEAPLDRFVAERTELAKRLGADARREDAAEARGLRKPSASLWAVNRLARSHGADVRALADAAGRLAEGDGEADADFRRALRALAAEAPAALEEAGRKATNAAVDDVVALLRSAVADDEARGRLVAGRLREEPEPAGFAAMAAARPVPKGRSAGAREGEARRSAQRRVAEAEDALAEARARARELRGRAADAERDATRAREAVEQADAGVERAEKELARARKAT